MNYVAGKKKGEVFMFPVCSVSWPFVSFPTESPWALFCSALITLSLESFSSLLPNQPKMAGHHWFGGNSVPTLGHRGGWCQ